MLILLILLINLCCGPVWAPAATGAAMNPAQENHPLTASAMELKQVIQQQTDDYPELQTLVSQVLVLQSIARPTNPLLESHSLHAETLEQLFDTIAGVDPAHLPPGAAGAWNHFIAVWTDYTEQRRQQAGLILKNAAAELLTSLAGTPSATSENMESAENLWRLAGRLERLVQDDALTGEEANTVLDQFSEQLLEFRNSMEFVPPGLHQPLFRLTKNAHILRGMLEATPGIPLEAVASASRAADALNAMPRGFLQRCVLGDISGWVYDPDQPQKPVAVILRVDGAFRSMHTANLPREGVPELAQTGSIMHGFHFETFDLVPGKSIVEIVAVDADTGDHYVISKRLVDK